MNKTAARGVARALQQYGKATKTWPMELSLFRKIDSTERRPLTTMWGFSVYFPVEFPVKSFFCWNFILSPSPIDVYKFP